MYAMRAATLAALLAFALPFGTVSCGTVAGAYTVAAGSITAPYLRTVVNE